MSTNKPSKDAPDEGGPNRTRKPRGMGGVILILALLMVLFLIVSRSGLEAHSSIDALYSHLLNGRVERLTLTDGVATAELKLENGRTRTMEVVVRDLLRDGNEIKLF